MIEVAVRWMSLTILILVCISIAIKGLSEDWLIGQRVMALIGLVPLSWYLTRFYFGVPNSLGLIALWLGLIVLSTSRTATAAALLLVMLVTFLKVWRRRSGGLGAISFTVCAAAAAAFLFYRVPAFRDRWVTGDTGWVTVGDVGINVSGRAVIWDAVASSARESPIVGKGMGSSGILLVSRDIGGHPHNDYLRLWHDVGFIGLGLFLFSVVTWASILAREWYAAERQGGPVAYFELSGFLVLLSLLAGMTTDNPVVYAGVMASSGILIGAGLGAGAHTLTVGKRPTLPSRRTQPLEPSQPS
jgi:O-antigen ligase